MFYNIFNFSNIIIHMSFIMNGMNQLRRYWIIFPRNSARTSPSLTTVSATLGCALMMSLGLWTWALCELGGLLFSVDINLLSQSPKVCWLKAKWDKNKRKTLAISNYQFWFYSKLRLCVVYCACRHATCVMLIFINALMLRCINSNPTQGRLCLKICNVVGICCNRYLIFKL